jgi:hypothetical protein
MKKDVKRENNEQWKKSVASSLHRASLSFYRCEYSVERGRRKERDSAGQSREYERNIQSLNALNKALTLKHTSLFKQLRCRVKSR